MAPNKYNILNCMVINILRCISQCCTENSDIVSFIRDFECVEDIALRLISATAAVRDIVLRIYNFFQKWFLFPCPCPCAIPDGLSNFVVLMNFK